jgi:DNA-binding MarR family transcriptional regulator
MITSDEELGNLLHELIRLHHKRISEIFAKHGLYAAQPHLLRILWKQDGRSQNDFVEKLHLQPATISNILKRMEHSGLITRVKDTQDHRITRVYLTDKGHSVEAECKEVFETIKKRWFKGFTMEEKILLKRLLLQISQNLSDD